MKPHFYSADEYFKQTFGKKMFRLSLDGGMTCPNRDGTTGTGGCAFCSASGSGDFAAKRASSVAEQIERAKKQTENKLPKNGAPYGYLAYFQSFTNTYAPIEYLRTLFSETIAHPEVEGLFIGTRPDCLSDEVIRLLTELSVQKPVYVELGFQSSKQESVQWMGRGYKNDVFEDAVLRLASQQIPVIVHCILGLPHETAADMIQTVDYVCSLPVHGIKLQLLHVLKGTRLADEYESFCAANAFACMERDAYFDLLCTLLEHIPAHIVIYRLTGDGPKSLLIAPFWSADKKRVQNDLRKLILERNVIQGRNYYKCNLNP